MMSPEFFLLNRETHGRLAMHAMHRNSKPARFPTRSSCTLLSFLLGAVLAAGCGRQTAGPTTRDISATESAPVTSSSPGEERSEPRLATLLDEWELGRQDEVIRRFLELTVERPAAEDLRISRLSERQFVALPKAEQDRVREHLISRLRSLREIAKGVVQKAETAHAQGDSRKARELLRSIKHVGAANRGPEVTELAGLGGRAIEELADERLADLPPE